MQHGLMRMWFIVLCWFLVERAGSRIGYLEERSYPFPHYQNPAPCPCDLSSVCDTYCCCDPDCTQEMRENHTCIEGLTGGLDEGRILEMNCSRDPGLYESYLYSILCIHTDNSPYLGEFHNMVPKVLYLPEFDRINQKKGPKVRYDYSGSGAGGGSAAAEGIDPEKDTEPYTEGVILKTLYDRKEGITGQLYLPQQSLHSGCTTGPVRYLKDSSSQCGRQLTEEACRAGKNTGLDHQMYIMDFPGIEDEPTFAQVLGVNNHLNITKTRVNYYTTETVDLYINVDSNPETPYPRENWKLLQKKRGRKSTKLRFQEHVENLGVEKYEKLPYFANFEDDEMECRNIVLEVRYNFYWEGSQILEIDVDILLGNISTDGRDSLFVQQYFDVSFRHSNASRVARTRSGNPGYRVGSPLISAVEDPNSGNDKDNRTLWEDSPGLQVWGSNSPSSLCSDSQLREVVFGIDTISECFVLLEEDDITNCDDLEQNVLKVQDSLFHSRLVASGGSLNFSNTASFTDVIYDRSNSPTTVWNTSLVPACQVPATVRVTVLYTHSGHMQGQDLWSVNGVRVAPVWDTWTWLCRERVTNGCSKIKKYKLRAEVEFVEIPVTWHLQNTTKFWIIQAGLSCPGDSCWEDILLPFTARLANERVVEVLYWILLAFLFIIPSYSFNKLTF